MNTVTVVVPTGNTERTVEMWISPRASSWAINRHTIFEYGFDVLHQAFGVERMMTRLIPFSTGRLFARM